MLYSYVIKVPNYLETEEAIKQYEEEIAQRKARQERLENRKQVKVSDTSIQDKLKRLKELRSADLITEEEYLDKKADILNSSF